MVCQSPPFVSVCHLSLGFWLLMISHHLLHTYKLLYLAIISWLTACPCRVKKKRKQNGEEQGGSEAKKTELNRWMRVRARDQEQQQESDRNWMRDEESEHEIYIESNMLWMIWRLRESCIPGIIFVMCNFSFTIHHSLQMCVCVFSLFIHSFIHPSEYSFILYNFKARTACIIMLSVAVVRIEI